MKKIIRFMLTMLVVTALLASCQIPGQIGGGVSGGNDVKYSRIIYADSSLDLIDVRNAVSDIVGGVIPMSDDSEASIDGEIVFGDTNRAVTAKAKAALEAELAKLLDKDTGYIVYSDGKNIAVYWNDSTLAEMAIGDFMTEFLSGKKIEIKSGVAHTEFYNSDDAKIEAAWAKIETQVSPDVLEALRAFYEFYDGTAIAGWVANLYDPEIGGFYYSISARDNEPFRPDIESTSQALSIMGECGAKFDRNTDLTEEIKAKIVGFIKSCQSPKDGYFYHPQWPQDKSQLNTDRYGRDMGSATNLIDRFTLDTDGDGVQEKQYPNYCTLNTKCEKHSKSSGKCVFPISDVKSVTSAAMADESNITDVIGVSVSSAVAKVMEGAADVIAVASVSSHPDYSSREAFKTWLYAYNNEELLRQSSGKAHNLSAMSDEIRSHGMQDIVFEQLDNFQAMLFEEQLAAGQTPTGCWQETADYQAVWGMYKYTYSWYNDSVMGKAIDPKYVPYMVRTALEVINQPLTTKKHMNDIMNQWSCISNLISNVKKYNPDTLDVIYNIVREDAAGAIYSTLDKVELYRVPDGSIGYAPGGYSLTSIYGVPISLGEVEGDCNAVHLCLCLYGSISSCLGISKVPIMTSSDIELFKNTISNVEPITKNEMVVESTDFENEDTGNVKYGAGSGTGESKIVEDPTDSSNKVLYFASDPQNQSSNLSITPLSLGGGCYIFETRMYVDSVSSSDYFMQIILHSKLYAISMHKVAGNKIELRELSTTSTGSTYNKIATVSMKDWFKLRVEYYTGETAEDMHIKVWIDDELVLSDSKFYYNHHIGEAPGENFTNVEIRSMKAAGTYIYVDDVYCSKETKVYNGNDSAISDARD